MKSYITFFLGLSVFGSLSAGATEDTQNQWITCFKSEHSYECAANFWNPLATEVCTRPAKCQELNLNHVMVIEEFPNDKYTIFHFPGTSDRRLSVYCEKSKIKKGRHCPISEQLQLR